MSIPPEKKLRGYVGLLNVGVVADVFFTVAVVAVAPGAVAELQFWVGYIRPATNGAAMGIGGVGRCSFGGIGLCLGEGDHFGFFLAGCRGFLSEQALCVCLPGQRDDIQKILAEEQEIICQGNQRKHVVGEQEIRETKIDHIIKDQTQIHHSEDPCFDGDDKEQQKMGIGEHGGIGQEQAQIQIRGIGEATEEHTENIH